MYELLAGTILQIIFLGICINFTLIFCQKKKPVEDLMARPKFTAPATATRASQEVRKINSSNNNNNGKPNVEHTISIKLDNNADDDDMQGPRESMSRDPMTELPPGTQKPKVVIQEEYDPDKGAETPPSNLQWDPNKAENKDGNKSSKKPAVSPMTKDPSSKRKRQRTVDLEATQEFKPSKEEAATPSNKPLSLKSARSGNPKRKSKSKPKNTNNTNKSHRAFSAMSIKTQGTPRTTPGKPALSPNCMPRNRDDPTKEVDLTQSDEPPK